MIQHICVYINAYTCIRIYKYLTTSINTFSDNQDVPKSLNYKPEKRTMEFDHTLYMFLTLETEKAISKLASPSNVDNCKQ